MVPSSEKWISLRLSNPAKSLLSILALLGVGSEKTYHSEPPEGFLPTDRPSAPKVASKLSITVTAPGELRNMLVFTPSSKPDSTNPTVVNPFEGTITPSPIVNFKRSLMSLLR